jgi:mannose-6-phosphate isomerase-like protein (cupin superfamily)
MVSKASRIKDIGPDPQSFDIESATKENASYRSVAWSGRYLQVTLMSIPVGEDIGLEAHPETDQFLRLDAGEGRVQMGPAKDKLTFEKDVSDGWCVLVPAGTWHNITNIGSEPM